MKNLFLFLSVLVLGVLVAGCASSPDLTGVTWRWVAFEETGLGVRTSVPYPDSLTIMFEKDGSLALRLDCNSGGGNYSIAGDSLKIELGATTLAYCGEESLDMQFTSLLAQVDGYEMEGGSLVLLFGNGTGRMIFEP